MYALGYICASMPGASNPYSNVLSLDMACLGRTKALSRK